VVIEDPVLLDQRVEYRNDRLTIVPPVSTEQRDLPRYVDNHELVELTLIAEVDPPELGGVRLQATHLALRGSHAYVSYNVAGSEVRGAVDAFDRVNGTQPILRSQVLFSQSDVSAVDFRDGKTVYLATGTLEGTFQSTAVLELVPLVNGGRNLLPETLRISVPSFVATGVAWIPGSLLATSGDGGPVPGGLSIFDDETMSLTAFDPFPDARAVVVEAGRIVAMKGSPAELRVYDAADGAFQRQIFVGGASIPESKSGLAMVGQVAAVAVGDEGVRLVDVEAGVLLGGIDVPDVPGLTEGVVSNAVAIHQNLLFVANGAAGLWVAQATQNIQNLQVGEDPDLRWVGSIQFADQTSINFVARQGNWIVAAGGVGGQKIISVAE